jgi:hypothetical protein
MTQPITNCPAGAGTFNTEVNSGLPITYKQPQNPYDPPELCIGEFKITQGDCAKPEETYQEALAAEALSISGAPVNVFKLLGVHEQGKLIDLTGTGKPVASGGTSANAFDSLAGPWISIEQGSAVTSTPAYLGYDFGIRLTSYGQPENAPGVSASQHITTIRLTQGPTAINRARQIRIDRSNGGYKINPLKVQFTGTGNGGLGNFKPGYEPRPGVFMAIALTPTTFNIMFTAATGTEILGMATVGKQYNSPRGSITITAGSTPFATGDMFSAEVELEWYRVDVVNVPDVPVALLNIKQSSASRYWRIVPLMFNGVLTAEPWIVDKLELFDFQATRLDNIQDSLLMENRDRDYANASIQLLTSYQPLDSQSDLSKFGFQVADLYTFTTSFAQMVRNLGRPIVVGDVLEVPSQMQYDHNLRPVRKFLEVTDVGWAADGYTTGWKPVIYKFTAQQLLPSQEHRDILGTVDTQKYIVDDGEFFNGIEQVQTAPLTITEANQAEAVAKVPEKGTNVREAASGTNRFGQRGSYDGVGPYVEDGLPPDGAPYLEGFKLPDVAGMADGTFFRLNYDPQLNIAPRLYKFSIVKNKFIYVETDRRTERSAHKPSQLAILNLQDVRDISSKL